MIIITRSCFRLYHEVNVIKSDMPVVQMCDTKQINSHIIDPREVLSWRIWRWPRADSFVYGTNITREG